MGILFSLKNDTDNMKLALIISVALIPYLMANLAPTHVKFRKIFMGDTGSMLIGFTVVWLLIQGTQVQGGGDVSFSASTALWLIAFPLMDMVRVITDRLQRGKSPFNADRSHLHHILQDSCGDSKQAALLKICTLSVFFAAVGIAMHVSGVREVIIFLTFLMGFFLYAFRVNRLKKVRSIKHI
jgi:UDP-GlcNAc:undecaprenyl-phosphate GlcNAc-1-phosphate transferase